MISNMFTKKIFIIDFKITQLHSQMSIVSSSTDLTGTVQMDFLDYRFFMDRLSNLYGFYDFRWILNSHYGNRNSTRIVRCDK